MKNWIIATYKTNEINRLERNLLNQKFDYYLPKITKKKINSKLKEELLFPGYVFVNIGLDNYAALKYTLGIRNIIKFGEKISCMSSEDIKSMQITEEASRLDPITAKIKIGQEAEIREGFFKGNLVKICSLASKKRVDVLIKFLGSSRKISIHEANLTL